jgi:predicted transcriptional regulator
MEMGQKFGVNNRKAGKVTAVVVEQMRRDYELGATQRELAEVSGLSVVQVGRIVLGTATTLMS